jgi:hypothetical protein
VSSISDALAELDAPDPDALAERERPDPLAELDELDLDGLERCSPLPSWPTVTA